MQLGMVGLGRMGANMVRRLVAHGHECVVSDISSTVVAEMAKVCLSPWVIAGMHEGADVLWSWTVGVGVEWVKAVEAK